MNMLSEMSRIVNGFNAEEMLKDLSNYALNQTNFEKCGLF